MRASPRPDEIAEIYIDESSQNNHRYLVLACVANMMSDADAPSKAFSNARLPELPKGETKWIKVSKAKLRAYKRIVDVLFDRRDLIHFHALVVDATRLDHRRFNEGNKEIGFNKEIYQLAMKCARLYPKEFFYLYPDYRETTQKPDDLRLILNRGCRKKGDARDWPFRRCQFRDSKKTLALQLVDVVMGAIAFKLNGHDRKEDASPAKCDLADYILDRAGIANPFIDTSVAGEFTIWHRQLQK